MEDRRSKARTVVCHQPTQAAALTPPPEREIPKCDPVPEVVPPVFFKPTAVVGADAVPARPDSILFSSLDTTVYCAELTDAGPVGAPVTVAAGAYEEAFYWSQVVDIADTQLDYISRLSDELITELLTADAGRVVEITKLSTTQAEFIVATFQTLRDTVAELARAQALQALDCVWHNEPTQAICAEGARYTGEAGLPTPSNPVVVLGGQFTSVVSQEDADEQAEEFAQSSLVCVWGNQRQVVSCADLGFEEAVPTDLVAVSASGLRRIGEVTVEAMTFFGNSQEEADATARLAGQSSLACFYLNEASSVSCAGIGAAGAVIIPGSLAGGQGGNPITIEAGTISSTESTEVANAEALQLALTLLDCYWGNQEAAAICPDREAVDSSGDTLTIAANINLSPVYTTTIAAGLIRSQNSQEDADMQALTLAQQQLDCVYCNPRINPACIPLSEGETLDNVPVPVTIPSAANRTAKGWSLDATPGVPAGTFCGPDPQGPLNIAESIGTIPIETLIVESCRYGNDEIAVSCISSAAPLVYGPFTADVGLDPDNGLDVRSYPPPFHEIELRRKIFIGENTFTILESDVPIGFEPGADGREKRYANQLALDSGLALLNCFFSNDAKTFTCAFDRHLPGVSPLLSTDNVTIEAGLFQSVSSKAEATAQAESLGLATLFCIYESTEQRGLCLNEAGAIDETVSKLCSGSEANTINPAIVAAGAFTSLVSQEDADNQAKALATSLTECFWMNVAVTVNCPELALPATAGQIGRLEGKTTYEVVANLFSSYTSQAEADRTAEAFGLSQTYCYYVNTPFSAACDEDETGSEIEIPEGLFNFQTPADAAALKEALKKCIKNEDILQTVSDGGFAKLDEVEDGADGLPGNDGAQRSCKGDCFGYYS